MLRVARPALTSLMIVAATAALLVANPSPSHALFADTAETPYADAVRALVLEDVMAGCGGGYFCSDEPMTRGQLATVLLAVLEARDDGAVTALDGQDAEMVTDIEADEADVLTTVVEQPTTTFVDVQGTTHEEGILQLADTGIVQGCAEDAYCPEEPVTRAQMATLLDRTFEPAPAGEPFFDDTGSLHGDAVDRLAGAGVAAGCGTPLTAFCPGQQVSRAQVALFLARAMDLVERVEVSPLEERRELQAEIDAEEEAAAAEAEAVAARNRIWDDLAQCESGGNWSINTGNGYYGGLQFNLTSWRAVGGSGYPHQHSREEQIHRAELLLERQGWGAWPACSLKLGYR